MFSFKFASYPDVTSLPFESFPADHNDVIFPFANKVSFDDIEKKMLDEDIKTLVNWLDTLRNTPDGRLLLQFFLICCCMIIDKYMVRQAKQIDAQHVIEKFHIPNRTRLFNMLCHYRFFKTSYLMNSRLRSALEAKFTDAFKEIRDSIKEIDSKTVSNTKMPGVIIKTSINKNENPQLLTYVSIFKIDQTNTNPTGLLGDTLLQPQDASSKNNLSELALVTASMPTLLQTVHEFGDTVHHQGQNRSDDHANTKQIHEQTIQSGNDTFYDDLFVNFDEFYQEKSMPLRDDCERPLKRQRAGEYQFSEQSSLLRNHTVLSGSYGLNFNNGDSCFNENDSDHQPDNAYQY